MFIEKIKGSDVPINACVRVVPDEAAEDVEAPIFSAIQVHAEYSREYEQHHGKVKHHHNSSLRHTYTKHRHTTHKVRRMAKQLRHTNRQTIHVLPGDAQSKPHRLNKFKHSNELKL